MSKSSSLAALAIFLAATACGSAPMTRTIYVNPPDASVYINGRLVQKGVSVPQEFDFDNLERICVQATTRDYEPSERFFTRREIEQMIRERIDLRIELRPQR